MGVQSEKSSTELEKEENKIAPDKQAGNRPSLYQDCTLGHVSVKAPAFLKEDSLLDRGVG